MARVEERVAHLDGQMNELSLGLSEIMGAISHLEQRIDTRFGAVDVRFAAVDAARRTFAPSHLPTLAPSHLSEPYSTFDF